MDSTFPIALIVAHRLSTAEASSARPDAPVVALEPQRTKTPRGRRLSLRLQRA